MRQLDEMADKELLQLTMKKVQNQAHKAKGDRFGATFTWRISMKDGRILNGYSKFEGAREKPDKVEVMMDNIRMFFKWDYIPKLANRIDYFMNKSHKIENAELLFSLYPSTQIFHRKEFEVAAKFAPVRDLFCQMYLDPDVNGYTDVDKFLSDQSPAKPAINVIGHLTKITHKKGEMMSDYLTLDQIMDPNKCLSRTPEEFANHIKNLRQNYGNQITEEHFQHYKTRVYLAKPHLRRL